METIYNNYVMLSRQNPDLSKMFRAHCREGKRGSKAVLRCA